MRIVVATTDVPPDPAGMPYQRWTYALITQLVGRGHDVWFSCIASTPQQASRGRDALAALPVDLRIYPPVRPVWSLRGKLQSLRMPFSRNIPDALRADVRVACDRGYDVLHLENFQWASYLGWGMPRALASIHLLYFIDWRGTGFRPARYAKARLLFTLAERRSLRRLRHFHVLTSSLGDSVRAVNPRAETYTVPISIDVAAYPVLPHDPASKVVGLIGGMRFETSRRAAVRLLTAIWPRVRARVPDAQLLIAGWAARAALAAYVDQPGVIVREDLADARDFWRECAVFAYPLDAGGGLKGKVLESLAYGVPLVTTEAGLAGVEAMSGVHAFVEDDDERFASRVIELLEAPAIGRALAAAGRALVEQQYTPEPVVTQMESVYRRVALAG